MGQSPICVFLLSISVISAADDVNDNALDQSTEGTILSNESGSDVASQTTQDTEKTTTPSSTSIKTKVSAPSLIKEYKKNKYFKVSVKDSNKKPVKKLKLKVKVYTGKKYKTYTIKTNSKGIAKLKTKNMKVGNHKVLINSKNSKYDVNKKSIIIIGKKKTLTLKINKNKDFKNGDYFRFFKESKNAQYNKGVYVENLRVHKGSLKGVKSHFAIKVKYTFKNKNGKTITKTSTSKNMLFTKLISGYKPVIAKITYLQS